MPEIGWTLGCLLLLFTCMMPFGYMKAIPNGTVRAELVRMLLVLCLKDIMSLAIGTYLQTLGSIPTMFWETLEKA